MSNSLKQNVDLLSALSMNQQLEASLMPSSSLLSTSARNDDFLLFGSGGQWTA